MEPVHIINIETVDNHEAATLGSFRSGCRDCSEWCCTGANFTLKLINSLEQVDDLESDVEAVLDQFQAENKGQSILHTLMFY